MTCDQCGQFFNPGQNSDMIQGGCPGCGQPLLDRQPGDVDADTQLMQNMPAPGESDMGGNPLKEGILADGGWQNRQKRDESFASVQSSWNDALQPKVAWEEPNAGAFPEQEGTPLEPGLEQKIKQIGQPLGEGQMCTNCGGHGCHRCINSGAEPIPVPLSEDPNGPLMDQVRQVGPYQGNTSSQTPYLSYLAGEDPDFEIEEVETPDPKSVKDVELKKAIKEFEKQAGLFGDVWNGFKGAGQFAWNHPAEVGLAAAGAGLMATGVGAPLGAGMEGAALGTGAAEAGAEGAGALGLGARALGAAQKLQNAGSWMGGALKKGIGGAVKAEGATTLINQGTGALTGGGGAAPGGDMQQGSGDPRTIQQITHVKVADDYDTPTSHGEIPQNRDGDANVKSDGDNSQWQKDYAQGDEGGGASTQALAVAFSPDTEAAYEMMFPLVHHFYNSEEDGSQHPLVQALHQLMETDTPGYLQHGDEAHESKPHDPLQADPTTDDHHEDNTDGTDSQIRQTSVLDALPGGSSPSPAVAVPQLPGAGPNQSKCINGHDVDPSSTACPQCGAPVVRGPGADAQNLIQPELQQVQAALGDPTPQVSPYIDEPDIPAGVQVGDYRKMRNMKGIFEQCPNCGMKNMMGDPVCRGCNMSLDSTRTASDHQGPHTPEQMAAVTQLLQQQGRGDEVPNMILQPWDYADELASIQHNPDVPDGEQQAPPMPPQEQTPPNAGMPMPGMSAPGPGAGAPAPQMMARVATDSVAKTCPKCKSHTTGLVSQKDGTSICRACGHLFKTPVISDDGHSTDMSTTAAMRYALEQHHHDQNFQGVPAADQIGQENKEREQDSTLSWQDESGQPLKVGQQYKMKSAQYDIPDIVRIERVSPESIEYSIVGEYGIAGNTKVNFLEAQEDGLTFQPFGSDPSQEHSLGIEQNDDDATQREDAGFETSDLSTPHQLMSATDPDLDWLREDGDFLRTAGARFTPTEQREFIEESGEARNRDKLNLGGTHYESSIEEDQFLFGL